MLIKLDKSNVIEFTETPWNTKVFGFKTNEITNIHYTNEQHLNELFKEFEKFSCNNNYQFTGIRISPEKLLLRKQLNEIGYIQVETGFELTKRFNSLKYSKPLLDPKIELRIIDKNDIKDIVEITKVTFNHGRFFEDPNISLQLAIERNINWVIDLCESRNVFIGVFDSVVFGFLGFENNRDISTLQLGGVKDTFKFLAYPFWLKSFLLLRELYNINGFKTRISAYNLPIIALYNYFGFVYKSVFIGFHKFRN